MLLLENNKLRCRNSYSASHWAAGHLPGRDCFPGAGHAVMFYSTRMLPVLSKWWPYNNIGWSRRLWYAAATHIYGYCRDDKDETWKLINMYWVLCMWRKLSHSWEATRQPRRSFSQSNRSEPVLICMLFKLPINDKRGRGVVHGQKIKRALQSVIQMTRRQDQGQRGWGTELWMSKHRNSRNEGIWQRDWKWNKTEMSSSSFTHSEPGESVSND